MKPLVALIGREDGWRKALRARIGELAEVVLAPPDIGQLPRPPVGAFVELLDDPDGSLRAIGRLHEAAPETAIVALAAEKDPDLILHAMRAGAVEFILFGEEGALADAVARVLGRHGAVARVVSLLPVRGGVGATTIATNLAASIALDGHRACVVDLDFQLGDVLLYLDLDPRLGASELLANADRLDGELLLSSLPRHGTGAWVVSQAGPVEVRDRLTAADIPRLVHLLKPHFDVVLLDGLRGFGEVTRRALDASDLLLLVLTQEIPAVKNGRLCLEFLRHLGVDEAKVRVVLNRAQSKNAAVSSEAVEDFLGRPIDGRLPSDYATVSRAIAAGRPLCDQAPRAQITLRMSALASLVMGHPPAAAPEHGGLLRALFHRHDRAAGVNGQEGAHGAA